MNRLPVLSRRARWAVPAGAVAVVAAVAVAGSMIAVAQATPELPARTPAQLLAAVAGQERPLPALTGTVVETASLGVPQLPGMGNQNSMVSLLAGSHTVKVWYADPAHVRLAVPVSMSETDLIRNGNSAWLWQSSSNTATHYLLPARSHETAPSPAPSQVPLTPQQAARQVLAAVGPTTKVSVQRNVTVAGQAAYQLVLAPKDSRSLIGHVSIAVDAARYVPLRVQVFARGAASPAFQVGYTSISFVQPAAANFAFTPPAGATVKTITLPGSKPAGWTGYAPKQSQLAGQYQVIGKDWLSVAVLPASALPGLTGAGNAASAAGQAARSVAGAPGGPGNGSGESAAVLGALFQSAKQVHGPWGSGKLLQTSLISILIMDNGRVLAGAVDPSVLYRAAAQVK